MKKKYEKPILSKAFGKMDALLSRMYYFIRELLGVQPKHF